MNAILGLINKYNLQDPVGRNEAGVFTSPELQELYNSLTEPVETLEEALAIGALIEDVDINGQGNSGDNRNGNGNSGNGQREN